MIRWRLAVVGLGLALLASACLAPVAASERATEAARELNLASRFGRIDIAVGKTNPSLRKTFLSRRASWGQELRVLDVELSGLTMEDEHRAWVYVDYSWVRLSEGTLRTTRVAQLWKDEKSGWLMAREKRVAGDLGLFGEAVVVERRARADVHFPTKTIR